MNIMSKKILILSLLFLSACALVSQEPVNSGIEGQVFIGPMCPVLREGEECPDQPYQADLTVTSQGGERIVQIRTEDNGKFSIPLPPGEYILHPESPNILPFASDQTVFVLENHFTEVIVKYDSGIR
ncbi:MAG TPA: hypothetical protein DCX53_09640 [Anaerolineae bacterium]|nr:hypothetical protein [Anaerolineae bacterium]